MSTILNALNKIEQNHHPRQVDNAARLVSASPRRSFRWPSLRGLVRRRWVWVIVPLFGLLIGGVFAGVLLDRSAPTKAIDRSRMETQTQPSIEPDIAQKRPPLQEIANTPHDQATPPLQPTRTLSEARGTAMEPVEMASSTSVAAKQPQETGSVSIPATPSNEASIPVKQAAATTPKERPPATVKNMQKPDPMPAVDTSLPFEAPRLTDNRLTVQAIVWSSTVEDRMAVVNNSIIRQGGKVDGFTIETIGEDQILVREGQQRYVVPFGSR